MIIIGKPAVLLFRGKGLISQAIRWQTRSEYSHAALRMFDGRVVESWQGKGVQVVELKSYDNVTVFDVPNMGKQDWQLALEFATEQVGKNYDYSSVLRFLSKRNAAPNDKWFCSELVCAALESVGIRLLERISPAEISPGMMSWSPLLKNINLSANLHDVQNSEPITEPISFLQKEK